MHLLSHHYAKLTDTEVRDQVDGRFPGDRQSLPEPYALGGGAPESALACARAAACPGARGRRPLLREHDDAPHLAADARGEVPGVTESLHPS